MGVEIGSPAAITLTWPGVVVVAGTKVVAREALLIPARCVIGASVCSTQVVGLRSGTRANGLEPNDFTTPAGPTTTECRVGGAVATATCINSFPGANVAVLTPLTLLSCL